jgi:osmotically-inducible protein OsmY
MTNEPEYLVGRIRNALATDPRVCKQDVEITILGGRVHLAGSTSTEERRLHIAEVAGEIAPEFEVVNDVTVLEVEGPSRPEVIA